MLLAATLGATLLRFQWITPAGGFEHALDHVTYLQLALILWAAWLVSMWAERLYDLDRVFWGSGEFSRLARALAHGVRRVHPRHVHAQGAAACLALWTLLATALALVLAAPWGAWACVRCSAGCGGTTGCCDRRSSSARNAEAEDLLRVLCGRPRRRGSGRSAAWRRHGPRGCRSTSARRSRASVPRATSPDRPGVRTSTPSSSRRRRSITTCWRGSSPSSGTVDVDVHISSGLFEVLTSRVLVREISGVPLDHREGRLALDGNLRDEARVRPRWSLGRS